ncbi:MAG: VCBS repeat-containing protein [Acidobacteria bacterium]|nr:VCBS repeat-containing protein [Acidobacteriota bacterium]
MPVFGPPLPRIRASDSEVLKAIQLGVGGSFRDFFANVFRDRSSAADDAEDRPESAEENPFQRALNSLAEQAAEPAAKAPEPAAADDSASKAPAEDPAKAPSPAGAAAVTTVRPLVVLHVGDDGVLQASAASRPREGAIESAKFGVKDFALLPFANPMDFPIALTVADFNGDSLPDVCAHVAWQGQLRFFFGASDGTYNELYRIDVGRGPRSIAAADLDGNGLTDLAVSDVGTGTLTALLAQPGQGYRFRVAWLDVYRDYIAAGRNVAGGDMEIVGVNFANRAEVLWAFRGTEVLAYSRKFEYSPALESQVADARGRSARLNTALFGLSWSINLENQYSQLTNVLNVAAGSKVHVVIGDVNTDGSLIVAIATPR